MRSQPQPSSGPVGGHRDVDTGVEPGLRAHVGEHDGRVVVAVEGEVDVATGAQLWHAVHDALASEKPVVVDLTATTFLGAVGLSLLSRARRHVGQITVRARPPSMPHRLLEISGLDRFVAVELSWEQPAVATSTGAAVTCDEITARYGDADPATGRVDSDTYLAVRVRAGELMKGARHGDRDR